VFAHSLHDKWVRRQGSKARAEKSGCAMSETQRTIITRLQERLVTLKERL